MPARVEFGAFAVAMSATGIALGELLLLALLPSEPMRLILRSLGRLPDRRDAPQFLGQLSE